MSDLTKHCAMCGATDVEVRTLPVYKVVWGSEGRGHGRHEFEIANARYYACPRCGEEFLDHTMMVEHEQKMNEWIKANLGFDWLAEGRKRRE